MDISQELKALFATERGSDDYWSLIRSLQAEGAGETPTEVSEQGRQLFTRLCELCHTGDTDARIRAVDVLAQFGSCSGQHTRPFLTETVEIFLPLLDTEADSELLGAVVIDCCHLDAPDLIEPLVALKQYPLGSVRQGVADALGAYESPLTIQTLIELTMDDDGEVRNWACFSLSGFNADTPEIRAALQARVGDPHSETEEEALLGLVRRGDTSANDRVLELYHSPKVSMVIKEAYGMLAQTSNGSGSAATSGQD
jgi:HEAT repeat protein